MSAEDPFAGKAEWFDRNYRETSHGRVRLELVLERVVESLPPPPASVLDAGGGTGAFAIPLAERGYDVTVLDRSTEWLGVAEARAAEAGVRLTLVEGSTEDVARLFPGGRFDGVLCHTLLLYLDDPGAALRSLRAVARSGAVLSVLEKNREGLAMRPGLHGEPDEARRVLEDPMAAGRLGIVNRARSAGELRAVLLAAGWRTLDWAGVRLFSDLVLTFDPDQHRRLLELERAAGRKDPYRRVARFVHLRATTVEDPTPSLEMVQARSQERATAVTRSAWPPLQAMSGPELIEFLGGPRYGVVSTVRPDGRSHATMSAYRHHQGRLYLPTESGAVRIRNLAAEPSLTFIVTEGARGQHQLVLIEGDVIVHQDPEPVLSGWLRDEWRRAYGSELTWASRIIEVVPHRVLSYAATPRS